MGTISFTPHFFSCLTDLQQQQPPLYFALAVTKVDEHCHSKPYDALMESGKALH